MYDHFLIAPLNSGLQNNVKPFLISDDAFERLNNAYVFRGRVKKRFGAVPMYDGVSDELQQLYTRFRIKLGTASGTVPGAEFNIGQMFSVGNEMLTVNVLGTPGAMLTTGGGVTGTFNTTSGAYVITGAGGADIYFYPSTPVMGFTNYELAALNEERLYGFDTQFAYEYSSSTNGWERLDTGADTWTGSDSQFFWASNYRGAFAFENVLFTTNFNENDGIRYWDGATWATLQPKYLADGGGPVTYEVISARLIIPFKGRLLLFNTIETDASVSEDFPSRCRWSRVGSPLETNSWRQDIGGEGGFSDAPISQEIVGAQLLRDRVIVFFERSTWELVYTNNEVNPFIWQQMNIELGVESTFSVVPFDKAILGVGNTGIHSCNGSNVERIDNKIPDEVFDFHKDTDSVFRVAGIRDYKEEMVYWSIPNKDNFSAYPDRILVYNYANGSWALNDDSITSFGYSSSVHETIVAGNQNGYTFKIDTSSGRNSLAMQITQIEETAGVVTLTLINHNLSSGDYIAIEFAEGITDLNDEIFQVNFLSADTVTLVEHPITLTGTYAGAGVATRVSQIDILTKQYNFYMSEGDRIYLAKVDFYVGSTDFGQILVDSSPSSSSLSMVEAGTSSGAILGTNVLETTPFLSEPVQATQDRFWHAVYFQTEGECVQLRLYLTDDMMAYPDIAWSPFELNAFYIHTLKTNEL